MACDLTKKHFPKRKYNFQNKRVIKTFMEEKDFDQCRTQSFLGMSVVTENLSKTEELSPLLGPLSVKFLKFNPLSTNPTKCRRTVWVCLTILRNWRWKG